MLRFRGRIDRMLAVLGCCFLMMRSRFGLAVRLFCMRATMTFVELLGFIPIMTIT